MAEEELCRPLLPRGCLIVTVAVCLLNEGDVKLLELSEGILAAKLVYRPDETIQIREKEFWFNSSLPFGFDKEPFNFLKEVGGDLVHLRGS